MATYDNTIDLLHNIDIVRDVALDDWNIIAYPPLAQ